MNILSDVNDKILAIIQKSAKELLKDKKNVEYENSSNPVNK